MIHLDFVSILFHLFYFSICFIYFVCFIFICRFQAGHYQILMDHFRSHGFIDLRRVRERGRLHARMCARARGQYVGVRESAPRETRPLARVRAQAEPEAVEKRNKCGGRP